NQTRIIANGPFARFSHNTNRTANLTLDKESRPVRPNNLHIPARPLYFPHWPHRRVTLHRHIMLTLHRRISKKNGEKRERIRTSEDRLYARFYHNIISTSIEVLQHTV